MAALNDAAVLQTIAYDTLLNSTDEKAVEGAVASAFGPHGLGLLAVTGIPPALATKRRRLLRQTLRRDNLPELRPPKRSRSPNPLPMVPPPGHVGPPALPLGWVEAQDPRYDNATYYFHARTKETSWTRPEEPLPTLPPPLRESREQLPPPLRATPRQPQTPEIEQQLDEWVTAKRNKDYEVADGLRALLKVRAKLVG